MADTVNVKISALTRNSLSSDLAADDYFPFNDNSAGDQATMAITIGGLDSYVKNNVDCNDVFGDMSRLCRICGV